MFIAVYKLAVVHRLITLALSLYSQLHLIHHRSVNPLPRLSRGCGRPSGHSRQGNKVVTNLVTDLTGDRLTRTHLEK